MLTLDNKSYYFSRTSDFYTGNSLYSKITFSLKDEELTVKYNNTNYTFMLDRTFEVTSEKLIESSAPVVTQINTGGIGLNFVTLEWNPHEHLGWFGVGVKIKKASGADFELVHIEYVYHNTFVVQLDESYFELGNNSVRLYYIGGPGLDLNQKQVYLINNSEYTIFNVEVKQSGEVIIE